MNGKKKIHKKTNLINPHDWFCSAYADDATQRARVCYAAVLKGSTLSVHYTES
jgi:hypothetical protein